MACDQTSMDISQMTRVILVFMWIGSVALKIRSRDLVLPIYFTFSGTMGDKLSGGGRQDRVREKCHSRMYLLEFCSPGQREGALSLADT